MCRNIRQLHNFDPPATRAEVDAACLQFVRKIGGGPPSRANADAYDRAVGDIAQIVDRLLSELVTTAPPKDREVEAAKAKARSAARFGA